MEAAADYLRTCTLLRAAGRDWMPFYEAAVIVLRARAEGRGEPPGVLC